MLTYNNKTEHTVTGFTPSEATKKVKELDVKFNLEMKAKRNRKYPDLAIGDKVKILLTYDKFKNIISQCILI